MSDNHASKEQTEHKPQRHASHAHGHAAGGHEEHEGAPEWLISFADNVMLMMGVFVILLALNMGKSTASASSSDSQGQSTGGGSSARELDFALAVREAFHNPVRLNSTNPADAQLVRRLRQRLSNGDERTGQLPASPPPPPDPLGPSEMAWTGGVVRFQTLSAELDQEGKDTIERLLPKIVGLNYTIDIRGYASPIEADHVPQTGYTLGYHRAMAVAYELVRLGIPWERIRIVSYGDSIGQEKQVSDQTESENHQRAEIMLLEARVQHWLDVAPPQSPQTP